VQRCGIFDLDRVRFERSDEKSGDFWVIKAPHWINVVPLTDDDEVLLVRQYRFGVQAATLEIPGGMCDADETPLQAASRELREETGCVARELVELGWVHPNPAIQDNRCYSFLARGAKRVAEPTPDPNESFEQLSVPLARIPQLIARGEITHSLVLTAFHLMGLPR